MRLLATVALALCLLSSIKRDGPPATAGGSDLIASYAFAQYQNLDWLEVSPPGESFRVSMPNQPRVETENVGAVSGNRYVALTAAATYTIWSLTNANYRADQDTDTDAYLDGTAELVWEGLLKPARENIDEKDRGFARMTYVKELPPEGLPGREYNLTIGNVTGTAEFFVAKEHLFVMLAMGTPGGDLLREKFFASFKTSLAAPSRPELPQIGAGVFGPGMAGPGIAGRLGQPEDYNRIFSGKEVTSKARVLEKPEPTYTESARKFGVTGTTVLRVVFAKNGEVTNISVLSKLPHGLTQAAMVAVHAIKFTPATKDGHPVSMWMQLQYNFNLY